MSVALFCLVIAAATAPSSLLLNANACVPFDDAATFPSFFLLPLFSFVLADDFNQR